MIPEDDFVMISALQHYCFCPRQCALIHVEGLWRNNALAVAECNLDWSQWLTLKAQLETICDPALDSLHYYNLGNNYHNHIHHYGAKPSPDLSQDLLDI